MSQNTSHAVMAQRSEPHDSLDDFPTPPWAARALCEHVIEPSKSDFCWEPACNRGYMVLGLSDYFNHIARSDICDYGFGEVSDFLFPNFTGNNLMNGISYPYKEQADWIITNPPFRLAEQFITRAYDICNIGCAMLVRTQFLESVGRYQRLFSINPPSIIAQFTERVPMVKGRVDPKVSTATSYCWVVWGKQKAVTPLYMWIPPCRKQLERPGDYD